MYASNASGDNLYGVNSRVYRSRTSTVGAMKCDTISFEYEPADMVQRHVIQVCSQVTNKEYNSGMYDRTLRIAEIGITDMGANAIADVNEYTPHANNDKTSVFNLSGLQLSHQQPGLNIIGGKKVFIGK